MKRILLVTMFLSLCMTTLFAQSQIATLSHDGEITNFYGADALREAHSNAENGDVITLSAGAFNSTDITKLVTIRGAGMGIKINEQDIYHNPTILKGNFNVTADGNSTYHFTLEGVSTDSRLTLRGTNHTQFIKCHFNEVRFEANHGSLQNCNFIHCYVSENFQGLYNSTFLAIGCIFKSAYFDGSNNLFTLTNCIIEIDNSPQNALNNTTIQNSIIIYSGDNEKVSINNSSIYNSLWVGKCEEYPFNGAATEKNNKVFPIDSKAFIDNTFFKLTDEAKLYLGSDNTEIGIYGGNLPFSPTTSNPQITKFNVASKTTADGKLSIDIEVKQP